MESSAVPGKTSSREQTHTFTNYPASHVDIDEVKFHIQPISVDYSSRNTN